MNNDLDNLNKAVDYLAEQKRKLDIASYYTHNDIEKAKNMASGKYNDLYVIKARFSASTTFGAFLLFFNIPYCCITNLFVIMSHSYTIGDLKTKSAWRLFEEDMEKINKMGNHDNEMTSKIRDDLFNTFKVKIGAGSDQRANELKKNLELNDEIAANRVIKKFIQDKCGFQNMDLSVDYEPISSLDMELFSITSNKIDIVQEANKEEKTDEEDSGLDIEPDEKDGIEGKDIQLILRGELILSPIKGKVLSSITAGDKVKINLDSSNPKAVSVAKAFKAYEDGKVLPITGRVVSIRHLVNGGYKIFCIIAKGIYVKIEEEEEDIRIAVVDYENNGETETNMNNISVTLIIVLVSIIIILGSIIAGLVFI